MLRAQDSATRERKNLNGLWQFALDPEGRVKPIAGTPVRWPTRARWRCRRASTTSPLTQPYATTSATSGISAPCGCRAAGRVSGSCCTSNRRRTGPRSWVNDTEVVSHEGGYTPSKPTSPTMSRPGSRCASPRWSTTTLHWQSIPPGSSRTLPPENGSATGTTSSITQVSTATSGSTPPTQPTSPTSRSPLILMAQRSDQLCRPGRAR